MCVLLVRMVVLLVGWFVCCLGGVFVWVFVCLFVCWVGCSFVCAFDCSSCFVCVVCLLGFCVRVLVCLSCPVRWLSRVWVL